MNNIRDFVKHLDTDASHLLVFEGADLTTAEPTVVLMASTISNNKFYPLDNTTSAVQHPNKTVVEQVDDPINIDGSIIEIGYELKWLFVL